MWPKTYKFSGMPAAGSALPNRFCKLISFVNISLDECPVHDIMLKCFCVVLLFKIFFFFIWKVYGIPVF